MSLKEGNCAAPRKKKLTGAYAPASKKDNSFRSTRHDYVWLTSDRVERKIINKAFLAH